MATPHIAGAMALLWSAIPSLRHQLTASRDALNNSAVHIASTQCGDCGPTKQRVWLGSGRYFRRGGRGHTDADAHCHPTATATAAPLATATRHGDRHGNGQPTATASPTATPRPTPTPRSGPSARPRPTPCPGHRISPDWKISGDRSPV